MKTKSLFLSLTAVLLFASCDNVGPTGTSSGTGTSGTSETTSTEEVPEGITIPDDIIIRYHQDDGSYANLRFWIWAGGKPGVELAPDGIDDFGMHITLHPKADFPAHTTFNFIMKVQSTWAGQSTDTEIKYEDFPPTLVNDKNVLEVWSIPGAGGMIEIYKQRSDAEGDRIKEAYLNTDWQSIHIVGVGLAQAIVSNYVLFGFTAAYFNTDKILQPSVRSKYRILSDSPNAEEFDIALPSVAQPHISYYVEATFASAPDKVRGRNVSFEKIYNTNLFKTEYTYTGDDLGPKYTPEYTEFRLWAPTATKVVLKKYYTGTPSTMYEEPTPQADWYKGYDMVLQNKGVWYVKIEGDLHGTYYNYAVTNSAGANEIVDPYAKGAGVNGARGMVVDFSRPDVTPEGWDDIPDKWDSDPVYDIEQPTDLTVYEVHIRDLTSDATWGGTPENAGKFKGFYEKGTTYTKGGVTVKTGFDHIEELGVNAIQILPFFDNDNDEVNPDFNWGYNPNNYNVVEGGYSLDPYDGLARIKELRELVHAYATNANHTRIIMDVVYNHVASVAASNLSKVMPKYYFRTNAEGYYTNGSGVGNETKSEAPMMRKLIVDSVKFWAQTYKIKGYRFDLMGLHDVETMRQVKDALYAIDPDFVTYGEGWAADGRSGTNWAVTNTIFSHLNPSGASPGLLGGFNDAGRNSIRGGNDQGWGGPPLPGYGFISQSDATDGTKESVANMMKGYFGYSGDIKGANPNQMLNYASCHDNYTLFDQLNYSLGGGATEPSIYDVAAASVAVNATVLMSQGIAFIHGAEDIFRTKIERTVEENNALPQDERIIPWDADDSASSRDIIEVYGKLITHNSYKSNDRTNSFKYDRKVDLLAYFNSYKAAVAARSYVTQYGYMTDRSTVVNTWISGNSIGMWVKGAGGKSDVCFFVNGRTSPTEISFDNASTATDRYNSLQWYDGYEYNLGGAKLTSNQKYLSLLFTI
ncbi:MAG: alpha-amylase family glycosyl hydrolase [Bacilli bacterium]|jgi:pullulanase